MVQGGVGSIHHNIIAGGEPFPGLYNDPTTAYRCTSFIDNLRSSSLTVYNNTMDFRRTTGPCAAVTVDTNSFLPSLRSNVFFDLKLLSQWSAVDQGWGTAEFPRVTPYPARLGYTDYNAFYYDPNANVVNNYALAVAGQTLRTSSSYGLHDLQPGGPLNQSVDPQFRGPLPIDFPFSIDDIKAGIVTVSQMLTYFRSIYTPVTGSPLIDRKSTR